jgi:hypothetical protein
MAAQLLFHRDPKRIVGVLRLTLLNRLNSSREWAELPLGHQTLHHDWLSGYRGLQKPLFILSLGIELAHSFNLNGATSSKLFQAQQPLGRSLRVRSSLRCR